MQEHTLEHPSGAVLTILDYGAHLTRWQTASGTDWLFLSRAAAFQPPQAIRGGVPIIFPQFNHFGPGPRHGFARRVHWARVATAADDALELELVSDTDSQRVFPFDFRLRYRCELGADRLVLRLHVENTGNQPLTFTAALHSYFKISDLQQIHIEGLQGQQFWDNDGGSNPLPSATFNRQRLTIDDAIDRLYFDTQKPIALIDRGRQRSLHLQQSGFEDTVIWNPGAEASARMGDLADDDYREMLCIEAARIARPVTLAPGAEWAAQQHLHETHV